MCGMGMNNKGGLWMKGQEISLLIYCNIHVYHPEETILMCTNPTMVSTDLQCRHSCCNADRSKAVTSIGIKLLSCDGYKRGVAITVLKVSMPKKESPHA